MKSTRIFLCLILMILTALPLVAQQTSSDGKESSSTETLKEDIRKLGSDLKSTATEAGNKVSQWFSDTGASIGDKATAATLQTKFGVVQSINKDNQTITIVETDGKSNTFAISEETVITIQDPITGLQTPFSGEKSARFRNIKKEDWVNIAYTLKDMVQNILPSDEKSPIVATSVEILR